MPVKATESTVWVVEEARAAGFELCGVARVEEFEELKRLPEWLARGYAGEMGYLRDARRSSPALALAGARSVIVCALNYNTSLPYSTEVPAAAESADCDARKARPSPETPGPCGWISRYAWGDDYHGVVAEKLAALLGAMRTRFGESFEARAYVDTGPVVERVAAKYAGLGWLGKNTCLIHPQVGSWLFLGVILTTLELSPTLGPAEAPPPDLCGNCRLCIDACPTGAIVQPYLLDARRCISYLTIELRGPIPEALRAPMGRMVFGCDICQDVCPWNRQAPVSPLPDFLPRALSRRQAQHADGTGAAEAGNAACEPDSLFAPALEWLAALSEAEYREVFRGSAVKRAKWRGLVRNACVALGNSGVRPGSGAYARIVVLLERLAGSRDPLVAEHARWALSKLQAV